MSTFGKYELYEQLGKGCFGTVYRAMDNRSGREVAIKELYSQLKIRNTILECLRKDANVLKSLKNPNLAIMNEVGETDRCIYIVMEYFPGGSLKQKMEIEGAIGIEEAIKIIQEVNNGLKAAHKKGMIHRDITPANILFDNNGHSVISDLGLARAVQLSIPSTTGKEGWLGTPAYRAPETWMDVTPASPATDIYSLACVLSEMLTGKVLFDGNSTDAIIAQHLIVGPKLPETLPFQIRSVLLKALEKNSDARYQTIETFENALQDAKVINRGHSFNKWNNGPEISPEQIQLPIEKVTSLESTILPIELEESVIPISDLVENVTPVVPEIISVENVPPVLSVDLPAEKVATVLPETSLVESVIPATQEISPDEVAVPSELETSLVETVETAESDSPLHRVKKKNFTFRKKISVTFISLGIILILSFMFIFTKLPNSFTHMKLQATPQFFPFTPTLSANSLENLPMNTTGLTQIVKLDFENNALSGITVYSDSWVLANDGTGNHVLENKDTSNHQWPGFNFGGTITNGIIQFRFKLIEYDTEGDTGSGRVDLAFRRQATNEGYMLSFNPNGKLITVTYVDKNGIWSDPISGSESMVFFEKNVWYQVRVELQGSKISIYLNDELINSFSDDHFQSGMMQLSDGPSTIAQFDDIQVWQANNNN